MSIPAHKSVLDRCDEWLYQAFGYDYITLPKKQAQLVLFDYQDAWLTEGIDTSEYKRRIGDGNLHAYAATLR